MTAPALPGHFSPSAADTFESCPRKWHAKYVLKVADEAGPAAEVGTMTHELLEELCVNPPGGRTPEAAKVISDRLWADMQLNQRRLAWGHVVRALQNLEVTHGDVVSVEERLRVDLAGVPFLGMLDRVDALPSGAVRVLDYKTGKRNAGRGNVYLLPKKRTLMLYAAAYEAVHGRPVQEAALVWTATGKVDDFDVDDVEIAGAVRWLRMMWGELEHAVEVDEFEARPGPLCSWCPAAGDCPEGQASIVERVAAGKSVGSFGVPDGDDVA